MNIPNCSICQWIHKELKEIEYSRCGAQGYKLTSVMWNNKYCKKLFKEKGNK